MKLLFDITPTQWIANGSGIYTTVVLDKLLTLGFQIDCIYNDKLELPKKIEKLVLRYNCNLFRYSKKSEFEKIVFENNYDRIYFGSLTNTNFNISKDIIPIVTIHDLRFIEVPNDKTRYLYRKTLIGRWKQILISKLIPAYDSNRQKNQLSKIINHPKLQIVTVSNHTKYSILLNYPHLNEERIHVLYCPYPELSIKPKNNINNLSLLNSFNVVPNEYFLMISAGRWFKNAHRAIQAFDNLASKSLLEKRKILVLGVRGSKKIMQVKNKDNFIFSGYVDDESLKCLLKNAYGIVYPSLQEGFGIPPLEAMQYGTPVLAAATSAIYEVCRNGANYFNPYNIMEIENRILQLLNDVDFYNNQCNEGISRVKDLAFRQKKDLNKLMDLIFNE